MRIWHRRACVSLVAVALLGLAAAGTATSSAAAVKPAPTTLYYYKLVNYDGKCLDAASGSGTGKVQQWGCNSNTWQYWAVYASGNGGALIRNYWTGQCLAASGDTTGSAVVQRLCNAKSNAQNWYTNNVGGSWFIYTSAQITGNCDVDAEQPCNMHPSGGSTRDGAGIYIQYRNSQNNINSFSWKQGARL